MFLTRPQGFWETHFIGWETEAQSHLPTKLQMKIWVQTLVALLPRLWLSPESLQW